MRTSAGIPPHLKRLHGKYGLPPLPRVDVSLHAGAEGAAPHRPEYVLVELAGKSKTRRVEPRPPDLQLLSMNPRWRCATFNYLVPFSPRRRSNTWPGYCIPCIVSVCYTDAGRTTSQGSSRRRRKGAARANARRASSSAIWRPRRARQNGRWASSTCWRRDSGTGVAVAEDRDQSVR